MLFDAGTSPERLGVYIVQADGSGLEAVLSDSLGYRCPSWAPDGARFAVAAYGSGRSRIMVVDLRSGHRQEVLTLDTAYVDCPQWAPHSEELVITVYDGTAGLYEDVHRRYGSYVALLNLRTSALKAITDGRGLNNYGHWSRDRRWIVFQSDRHAQVLPDSTGSPPPFDSLGDLHREARRFPPATVDDQRFLRRPSFMVVFAEANEDDKC